ncbi:glycerophosphodiester phosphodiesterase [Altererythrobacter salegens]|uniref:Glycerophosphodiester phosphodiesterase n=1 Tax=Croceibacterium salegens TaxID=1737568 RepID=A0A6I4T0J3_9SPHN|nr:glycerophosphodiester phosphodiesterase family protein [Croceibacterium salegens]MXO61098.1 glycerophosphodiester phosphodiesterase [Croceibacterium salegens]
MSLVDAWFAPAPDPARVAWLSGHEYAHRGLHTSADVENSPGAFAAAIARGMGIECDIQLSGDGQAMVFHDWELDRLTAETGPVADRTAAELGAIALGSSGERIPTLRDLLGLVRGRVPLLIEIKSRREMRIGAVCLAVRRVLEGYGGEAAIMSFDPRVAAWFGRNAPGIVRGLVVTEENDRTFIGTIRRYLWLWDAKPDFLAYDVRDLPSGFAAAQRRRGLPLLTWTVRTPALRLLASQFADAPIAEGEGVANPAPNR